MKERWKSIIMILGISLIGVIISKGSPSSDVIMIDRIMLKLGLSPWSGNFTGFHYGAIVQIIIFIATYNVIRLKGGRLSGKIERYPFISMLLIVYLVGQIYEQIQNMVF